MEAPILAILSRIQKILLIASRNWYVKTMKERKPSKSKKVRNLKKQERREAQEAYDRVLKDQARYAESQKKKEIQDQKRETLASDRLQPSGLASGGRRD